MLNCFHWWEVSPRTFSETEQVSVDALRETQPHCLCCSVLWWHVCPEKVQRRGSTGTLHSVAHTPPKSCFGRLCQKSKASRGILLLCKTCTLFFFSLFVNALVTEKQSELEQSQQSIRLEKHSDTWSPCHKTLCKQCKKTLSAIIADSMDILPQPKFTQIRCQVHAPPDRFQGWHFTILWSLAGHFHWPRTLTLVVTRIKEKCTKESWRPVWNKAEALCAKGSTSCTSTAAAAATRDLPSTRLLVNTPVEAEHFIISRWTQANEWPCSTLELIDWSMKWSLLSTEVSAVLKRMSAATFLQKKRFMSTAKQCGNREDGLLAECASSSKKKEAGWISS